MRITDHDRCPLGEIIPFQSRSEQAAELGDDLQATTIATLVAVTVLHGSGENPEDKLLALIEQSGEIEVLDALDATADLHADAGVNLTVNISPSNDNEVLSEVPTNS